MAALSAENKTAMKAEIAAAGCTVNPYSDAAIFKLYNIWVLNPQKYAFASKMAELVYIYRNQLSQNQQWHNVYRG